jgi:putative ABC transport system permease protein
VSQPTSWSQRLYDLLLQCYPAAFREEYGRDMHAAFRRLWREEQARGGAALAHLSLSVILDTLATATREHLSILRQDIRVAARSLRKTPAFTLAAVTTLALGIGATTAMFSVVYTVLLRPLPLPDPTRLVELVETKPLEGITSYSVSTKNFQSWQERTSSFTSMAALLGRSINLADDGEPERVRGMAVSSSLWPTVGVRPIAGRTFDPDEDTPGRERVALISDGLWQRRYSADRGLIGKSVRLGGVPHTIIGVVPTDLGFRRDADVWVPFVPDPEQSRGDRQLTVLARLRAGVDMSEASAELESVAAALAREFPESNAGHSARVRPLLDLVVSPAIDGALKMLLAAVGLLLLVACANVANLVLTRATARGPELALRRALGASSARLTRQVVTETLVVAAVGGVCGVLVAAISLRVARTTLASMLPRASDLSLDLPVLGSALVVTLATGLAFGLIPAWRVIRGDVTDALRTIGRALSDRSHARLRQAFVVGQFCLATMLVIGAALLAQSLVHLMRVDVGFRTDHLLMTGITLPVAKYATPESRDTFFRQLIEAVRAEAGVVSAGLATDTPLTPGGTGMEVGVTGASLGSPLARRAFWRVVTPGYFETLGIPLLRGRPFEIGEPDIRGGFRPLIVSESVARRLWPDGSDPIGRRVWLANGQERTIIGVVGDVHENGLADGVTPTMYLPTSWFFPTTMTLVVRTSGAPSSLAPAVRQAVRRLDPQQPLFDIRTMEAQARATTIQSRLNASLLGLFALLALVLGAVGLAGVVAHAVAQRRPELAVRMALGAQASRVAREVAAHGIRLCLYGLIIGLAGAWALRRVLSSFLFGVQADDPTIFGTVAVALFAVALAACWLPASRVTRIDPATVLRGE